MKYIKKIERFTSPYTKNIDTRPITFYKKIAWLFPTDNRFKNLFNSTKPLNHFKYPFGKFTNFLPEENEKFIIIIYELTDSGEKWDWFIYEGESSLRYLKHAQYDFKGPVGLSSEEYDIPLLSLSTNKYNL